MRKVQVFEFFELELDTEEDKKYEIEVIKHSAFYYKAIEGQLSRLYY